MNEPKLLGMSELVMEVASGLLVAIGIGGATLIGKGKAKIEKRLNELEQGHGDQVTQLAVLKTCQENTRERLTEIADTTRDTNQSLKELSQTITQIALGMKK